MALRTHLSWPQAARAGPMYCWNPWPAGTPVIATTVGGNPEVVSCPDAGILLSERSAKSIAEGVHKLFTCYPDRSRTRRYAEKFDWYEISELQMNLFRTILGKKHESEYLVNTSHS